MKKINKNTKYKKKHFPLLHGMYVLFSTAQVITDHSSVQLWLLLSSSATTSTKLHSVKPVSLLKDL